MGTHGGAAGFARIFLDGQLLNGKPIIGIAGGIGSGKSFVAKLFGELGCLVLHADEQVKSAYADPAIRQTLQSWWGPAVFNPDGSVNRPQIATLIFSDSRDRLRLEQLLHPWVDRNRREIMTQAAQNPQIHAFVLDTPLLLETGLNRECDAVVFVDAPDAVRLDRVRQQRGWNEAELSRREKLQWPLDKKREISDYVAVNTAEVDAIRGQVRDILSRIFKTRPLA